jgi:hypothetical protein
MNIDDINNRYKLMSNCQNNHKTSEKEAKSSKKEVFIGIVY